MTFIHPEYFSANQSDLRPGGASYSVPEKTLSTALALRPLHFCVIRPEYQSPFQLCVFKFGFKLNSHYLIDIE